LAALTPPASNDLDALYTKQIYFRAGNPILPIRVIEGRQSILFSSSGPMRMILSGESQTLELSAGVGWTARVRRGKPAELALHIQVAELPHADRSRLAAEAALWEGRGFVVRVQSAGALYGLRGKVIDNRRQILLIDTPPERAEALRMQATLRERYGHSPSVFEQIVRRPTGQIEVLDPDGKLVAIAEDEIRIESLEGRPLQVRQVEFGVGYSFHGFEDRAYRGALALTLDRGGALAVVNVIPLEELLKGLVPAEMFPRAPIEALKAQAIAARGEVLAKIGTRHLADPYFLCSEQHCAVYRGVAAESPSTSAAVDATRGIALFSKDGKLVNSVYSAVCGGHTEDNDRVWDVTPDPSLRGKADLLGHPAILPDSADLAGYLATDLPAACRVSGFANSDRFRWERRFSAAEMDLLAASLGIGSIRSISVEKRGVSGRAQEVRLGGDRGLIEVRGELEIRKLFGMLNSAMFVVTEEAGPDGTPAGWIFRGGGWGHGVGMCQMGAIGRALAGQDYREILAFYFNGAQPAQLY